MTRPTTSEDNAERKTHRERSRCVAPNPEPRFNMDSVDLECQAIFRAVAKTFAEIDTHKEPCGVGTAISMIYNAIDEVCRSANLSPGQARLVCSIVTAAFEYGKAHESYRNIIKGW